MTPDAATSYQLGEAALPAAPYAINGGNLVDRDGKVVAEDLAGGPFWAARAGESNWWVISDGQTLLVVEGEKEQWRAELPAGNIELNGSDNSGGPGWLISGNAVIFATNAGIMALNITDGDLLWRVGIPVSSWASSARALPLETEGRLAVLPYPEEPSAESCAEWAGPKSFDAVQFTDGCPRVLDPAK